MWRHVSNVPGWRGRLETCRHAPKRNQATRLFSSSLCPLVISALLLAGPAGSAPVKETLQGHKHTITCLAYSRDGKLLASGSKDSTARLWDAQTGKPIAVTGG